MFSGVGIVEESLNRMRGSSNTGLRMITKEIEGLLMRHLVSYTRSYVLANTALTIYKSVTNLLNVLGIKTLYYGRGNINMLVPPHTSYQLDVESHERDSTPYDS